MALCQLCEKESELISELLGVCADCIREGGEESKRLAREAHERARLSFDMRPSVPNDPDGVECKLCANECKIGPGRTGYCGARFNEGGSLRGGGPRAAAVQWYFDALPTNCVADWVCPGGTDAGFPRYSYSGGPEYGHYNLAVFYEACSFDCLFCQNWHFRQSRMRNRRSATELAGAVNEKTACICYFGGDPTAQLPHALSASRKARRANEGRVLRICWETNGSMNPRLLKQMAELSMESGGCIKFDLKAWDENMHLGLCGVSNKRTLENFAYLAALAEKRPDPPFLIASTLLVPGYVMEEEVGQIASYIASLDRKIPYSLLAFHPDFCMRDLPTTSRRHALMCKDAAEAAGVANVRIGNLHLLKQEDYGA